MHIAYEHTTTDRTLQHVLITLVLGDVLLALWSNTKSMQYLVFSAYTILFQQWLSAPLL
jgi:hypothetical protein